MADRAPENFILVVCEAKGDFFVARGFGERILLEEIEWLRDSPAALPAWGGLLPAPPEFSSWVSIRRLYSENADLPPIRGLEINGQPPDPDAIQTLKALRLAEKFAPLAVVLLRDMDATPERKNGLEQGRTKYKETSQKPIPCMIGLPDRYREAWLLASFSPHNTREEDRLEEIQRELGSVHPIEEPHRLRDSTGEPRCAKDIWNRLSDNDSTREEACWSATPLEDIRRNGVGSGLSAYLEEVKDILVPILTRRRNP